MHSGVVLGVGGSGSDWATHLARDAAGSLYIAGLTTSNDFLFTNRLGPTISGAAAGFVAKLTPDGSTVWYSTSIGSVQGIAGLQLG